MELEQRNSHLLSTMQGFVITARIGFCQTDGVKLYDSWWYNWCLEPQKGKNHLVSACRRVPWGDL